MDGHSDTPAGGKSVQIDPLPEALSGGSTVLVAYAGAPSDVAVSLRILASEGTAEDTALIVTTTESADRTIEVYTDLGTKSGRPSIGIVDTTSEHPSVSALYEEIPVVFTPSSRDLERLVMALSELSDMTLPGGGTRHLVFRSLTPILETSSPELVSTVLERITGLRSETGLGLFGIDYTAHDEETMEAMVDLVDGVLWVTHPSPDRLTFEYQRTRGRGKRSMLRSDAGE